MLKIRSSVLALASLFIVSNLHAQYADSVVSYTPGSGVNPSFTDPSRSLGAPTSFIGYQNADPFNPPYQSSHLVSIGEGGTLTVQFSTAIPNDSSHSYGLDFLIFGNSGFIITNGDYSGGGITDGSLFANNPGSTRVWVSADNVNYYALNPALAPVVDVGTDVFAFREDREDVAPIQVKSGQAEAYKKGGGYRAQFNIP